MTKSKISKTTALTKNKKLLLKAFEESTKILLTFEQVYTELKQFQHQLKIDFPKMEGDAPFFTGRTLNDVRGALEDFKRVNFSFDPANKKSNHSYW